MVFTLKSEPRHTGIFGFNLSSVQTVKITRRELKHQVCWFDIWTLNVRQRFPPMTTHNNGFTPIISRWAALLRIRRRLTYHTYDWQQTNVNSKHVLRWTKQWWCNCRVAPVTPCTRCQLGQRTEAASPRFHRRSRGCQLSTNTLARFFNVQIQTSSCYREVSVGVI